MDEFALIDAIVAALGSATSGNHIVLGPGDDASLATVPPNCELASSIDTFVEGVHFPRNAPGEHVGHRVLGAAVSDLAAMGASPLHALVAVTLEADREPWLLDLARGIGAAARSFEIAVVGGNLSRGPLNVTVSVHGYAPTGAALRRSGARVGDRVFLSGDVGAAGAALAELGAEPPPVSALSHARAGEACYGLARYYLPQPRLALGVALRGIAHAAIDVSDGLVADLSHVCRASGVGALIELERVPVARGVAAERAVVAGDDYELAFTAPAGAEKRLREFAVTEIGEIVAGSGVDVLRGGRPYAVGDGGFRHFT